MCRMFCLSGEYSSVFPDIKKAFMEVTRRDPIISNSDGTYTSHDDGWGYVHHDGSTIVYGRSGNPVFNSEIPPFKSGNLVIHARKAAPNEPFGASSSHPHMEYDGRFEVYLSHNGWFDKFALAKELGINNPEKYVDSQLFLKFLMSFPGSLENRLRSSTREMKEKRLLKSTANLMVLGLDRETQKTEIYCYTDVAEGRDYTEYVTLYKVSGSGWRGIFSSSLIVPEYFPMKTQAYKLPRGAVISL